MNEALASILYRRVTGSRLMLPDSRWLHLKTEIGPESMKRDESGNASAGGHAL